MAILYVTATPIGNLQDFSPRGIETLKTADIIIAEDTRVTMKLGQVFGFQPRMISCHRHNEDSKADILAEEILQKNLTAALVTDAGTPCISDPGCMVVKACIEKGVPVVPVPGCCAGIAALSVSGFDAREFAFYGFLPREKKDLKQKLTEISKGVPIAIIHESPHRITELAGNISEIMPEIRMTVCCDLTKLHEKTLYGTPGEIFEMLRSNEKTEKGEYCVVLDFHNYNVKETDETLPEHLSIEAKLAEEISGGMTLREAQDALVRKGEKKNAVKQAALKLKRAVG